jgi:hypothetical protein
MPLSRGHFGFVALRCYAEECAFFLSAQAQDHVWDLVEFKRVEPATAQPERLSEGQDASKILCGAYHYLCLCARLCSLHD